MSVNVMEEYPPHPRLTLFPSMKIIRSTLVEANVIEEESLVANVTSCSPQNVALLWLAEDTFLTSSDVSRLAQRYVLAVFVPSLGRSRLDTTKQLVDSCFRV